MTTAAPTAADGTTNLTARAVLFDMDGTLVDSTAVVEQVWTAFAAEHGLDAQAIIATGLADTVEWYRANENWWRPSKAATEAVYAAQGQ